MYDLKELGLLAAALTIRKVPFTFKECNDGWMILGSKWDVAINSMTMGGASGLLEILNWEKWRCNDEDAAVGFFTASECIEYLQNVGLIPRE